MQVGTDVWVKNVHLDMFNNDPWLPSTVLSKVRHTALLLHWYEDLVIINFFAHIRLSALTAK